MVPLTHRRSAQSSSSSFSQLTYDLPHAHIYTSKFYPRSLASRPTALSEILVYGHESGITILWRARGSSKKVRKDTQLKPEALHNNDGDDMMILDGPSYNPTDGNAEEQEPEGSEEVGEDGFACSYTIHIGTSVHHISFPPASILPSNFDVSSRRMDDGDEEDKLKSLPSNLLQNNFLIAAACGDRAIRLVVLPRAPPASTPSAQKREHIIVLGGGVTGHHDTISAISLSIVPSLNSAYSPATSPTGSPTASPHFNNPYSPPRLESSSGWDILLASSSADTTGTILFWRISLLSPARNSPLPVTLKHTARPTSIFLHSPATSLSFNTAPTSISRRHHLLISDTKGAIRILDTHNKSWLCSFYTPFSQITDRRKKVLSVQWCTGGRGIIVLCEDGEWGIWDLEGVLSRADSATVTSFLVGGVVGETWYNNRKSAQPPGHADDGASEISGRSPSSRAMSVASTATGTTVRRRRLSGRPDLTGSLGLLSVAAIPGSSFFSTPASLDKGKSTTMGGLQINDEIITFVFGGTLLVLPSLRRFWKVEEAKILKRANRAGGASLGSGLWNGEDGKADKEFVVLEGWNTSGAVVTGVDVVPPGRRDEKEGTQGRVARVLLGTRCRAVVVDVNEPGLPTALVKAPVAVGATPTQESVKRSIMTGGKSNGAGESGKGKRKVGFLQDS